MNNDASDLTFWGRIQTLYKRAEWKHPNTCIWKTILLCPCHRVEGAIHSTFVRSSNVSPKRMSWGVNIYHKITHRSVVIAKENQTHFALLSPFYRSLLIVVVVLLSAHCHSFTHSGTHVRTHLFCFFFEHVCNGATTNNKNAARGGNCLILKSNVLKWNWRAHLNA